jgi:hypothetical protein
MPILVTRNALLLFNVICTRFMQADAMLVTTLCDDELHCYTLH